jgi:hypothetical protein
MTLVLYYSHKTVLLLKCLIGSSDYSAEAAVEAGARTVLDRPLIKTLVFIKYLFTHLYYFIKVSLNRKFCDVVFKTVMS